MVVTMECKPIDKYILANLVRTFGLPVPSLMMGLGMAFHQKLESIGMKAINPIWTITVGMCSCAPSNCSVMTITNIFMHFGWKAP